MSGRKFVIEKDFVHRKLRCIVVFNDRCIRCGYVAVTDNPKIFEKIIEKEEYFDVHWGVTYAKGGKGSTHPVESDMFWLGFDCGHYGDERDIDLGLKYGLITPQDTWWMWSYGGNVKSEEYVSNECKKLADQVADLLEVL